MVELRLVGLSEDSLQLIFANPSGQKFTVPVDDRLRAALRGDRARLGQLEIQMDSALRPRDIQARIRAGESPEAVAQVAQVPVDKIMGYAVPVLAEREHVAERAQRCAVRRKTGDGPGQLLGDAVAERLRAENVDPGTATWDAWRREDGKWTVIVGYATKQTEGTGTFTFDPLGRYTLPDDEPARWLVGESEPDSDSPTDRAGDRAGTKPTRRLAAVTDDRPEARPADADADGLTAVADAVGTDERAAAEVDESDQPVPEEPDEPVADAPGPKKRGRKTRGRASVPSWDEIMFGGSKE